MQTAQEIARSNWYTMEDLEQWLRDAVEGKFWDEVKNVHEAIEIRQLAHEQREVDHETR